MITGHMRSGTTMLRNLCNSHPDLSVTNELRLFLDLGAHYRVHFRNVLQRIRRKHHILGKPAILPCLRYVGEIMRRRPQAVDLPVMESTLRGALGNVKIVGDKMPGYWIHLDRFVLLPDLFRVFVYRDCRDVASSVLARCRGAWRHESFIEKLNSPAKAAASWRTCMDRMERHRDELHIIRYETLVRDPMQELMRLSEALEIDVEGFSGSWTSRVHENSIGKHRDNLTGSDLDAVLAIAGPSMERLEYL